MALVLRGRGAYVDDYDKLYFEFVDGDTRRLLVDSVPPDRECDRYSLPYDYKFMAVVADPLTDDVRGLVGKLVDVTVDVKTYRFRSKYANSRGKLLGGAKLVLVDFAVVDE